MAADIPNLKLRMKPANTVERLTVLELLLLSFVREGLTTPYDLISKAGLSVGVTSPAFKRLVRVGLLTATKGSRNRDNYALTERGSIALRDGLRSGLADFWKMSGSAAFELFPRALLLVWMNFGPAEAERCIATLAEILDTRATLRAFEAERDMVEMLQLERAISGGTSTETRGALMASALRYIKATLDIGQLRDQAKLMQSLGSRFSELPLLLFNEPHNENMKEALRTRRTSATVRLPRQFD